jgi:hypothetical protein
VIEDIIEEIRKVNQMVDLHSINNDIFMLKQYQFKRDQLISELEYKIEELKEFKNWKSWRN